MVMDVRDLLRMFHVWSLLIMAVGVDPFAEDQPMEGLMLGDYIGKWSPALRAFFTGLARNGLSTHADEIPLAGFLAFLRFYTLLRRDAWAFPTCPATAALRSASLWRNAYGRSEARCASGNALTGSRSAAGTGPFNAAASLSRQGRSSWRWMPPRRSPS